MMNRLICVAGATASVCAGAFAQVEKSPQLLGSSINVSPVKIAKARLENGQVIRTTDWIDYKGGQGQRGPVDERVFDCFGDADSDGFMDDTGGCGLSSSRWFFGTGYCNGFATNDMVVDSETKLSVGMGRADFGWYWTCGGFGTEQCVIGLWTQESIPCTLDSGDYSGWLLNFGTLSCNPGGYYYTNADISSIGTWPVPASGDGSYLIAFLTDSGDALATCAQPMLWGDGVDDGGAVANPRGSQGPFQFDDDNPLDGSHTTSECYDYTGAASCPDPLGAMMQFWGERGPNPCVYADCNGDGAVNTQDFTCFFNLWVPKNPKADCNGDGAVNTQDVTCFLNIWNDCRP